MSRLGKRAQNCLSNIALALEPRALIVHGALHVLSADRMGYRGNAFFDSISATLENRKGAVTQKRHTEYRDNSHYLHPKNFHMEIVA